jgi:L-iditol 2-dehydrogenase
MRVAMYYNNRDVRLQEIPKPKVGAGEFLVKVMACGICGSDVLEWYRVKKAPRVLGHEATGEIVEVGKAVKGHKIGDRVFVSHHVPCGKCKYCLSGHETACETLHTTNYDPGGFSEFVRVPKINVETGVYRLPANVSFEEGTFIEPLACVVRGQRLAGLRKGDTVLVLGSGISGLLHIILARLHGAGRVIATDVNDYRLKAARRFGVDAVIDARENVPEKVREFNDGKAVDRVVVCTGAPQASEQAMRCVDRGGSVLFFAVPGPDASVSIPATDFWRDEVSVMTSYGAAPRDLEESLNIFKKHKPNVRELITHRLGLAETGLGFRMTAEARDCLKVIIEPYR